MLLFMVRHTDDLAKTDLRHMHRPEHLDWLTRSRDRLAFAGPLLKDDGPVGSLLVVEADDEDAALAWAHEDPLYLAGLFVSTEVVATRQAAI